MNVESHFIDEDLVVNKTLFETIKHEVTCQICYVLLNNPILCSKCETPYCSECINKWKIKDNTCVMCKGDLYLIKTSIFEFYIHQPYLIYLFYLIYLIYLITSPNYCIWRGLLEVKLSKFSKIIKFSTK